MSSDHSSQHSIRWIKLAPHSYPCSDLSTPRDGSGLACKGQLVDRGGVGVGPVLVLPQQSLPAKLVVVRHPAASNSSLSGLVGEQLWGLLGNREAGFAAIRLCLHQTFVGGQGSARQLWGVVLLIFINLRSQIFFTIFGGREVTGLVTPHSV